MRSFLAYKISELVRDKPGVGKVWCSLPVLLLFDCRLYYGYMIICCFCIEKKVCVFSIDGFESKNPQKGYPAP